jgi:LEA14-like dessication related protein
MYFFKKLIFSIIFVFLTSNFVFAQLFTKPTVTFSSFSIESIGINNIGIRLFLNIENPNILGIEIKKIEYKVNLNEIEDFAEGITDKVIKIEKNSKENPIEIPVTIKNKKVFSVIKSIILNPEKINYKVTGKVYFGTFIGDISIPFSKESYIDNSESINKIKEQIKKLKFF